MTIRTCETCPTEFGADVSPWQRFCAECAKQRKKAGRAAFRARQRGTDPTAPRTVCLDCPTPLPKGSPINRLYCSPCRRRRQNDLRLERERAKAEAKREEKRQTAAVKPPPPCASCDFAQVSRRGENGYLCVAGGGMLRCKPYGPALTYRPILEEAT